MFEWKFAIPSVCLIRVDTWDRITILSYKLPVLNYTLQFSTYFMVLFKNTNLLPIFLSLNICTILNKCPTMINERLCLIFRTVFKFQTALKRCALKISNNLLITELIYTVYVKYTASILVAWFMCIYLTGACGCSLLEYLMYRWKVDFSLQLRRCFYRYECSFSTGKVILIIYVHKECADRFRRMIYGRYYIRRRTYAYIRWFYLYKIALRRRRRRHRRIAYVPTLKLECDCGSMTMTMTMTWVFGKFSKRQWPESVYYIKVFIPTYVYLKSMHCFFFFWANCCISANIWFQ